MGLLGDGFDDPRSQAIMALSGGLLRGDFGGGILGANDAFRQAKQDAAKQQFMKMQMDNYASEIEQRKAAVQKQQNLQALMERYLGGGGSAPAAPGQLGSGSFGVMPPPAGMPDISPAQPAGSRIGSIPPDVLALMKAQGLDLVDVAKFARPDMQVSNGYAYDKNSVRPGYLPQLSTSQDGKTSMVQIGRDGMPVVSAPAGALDTFARYQNVQEGTKANYDPVTVTPQGENPQMTTRGALVRNPAVSGRVTPQEQASRDAERSTILQAEVTKARAQLNDALARGDQSAAARAQADLAALERELGGRRPSVGLPLQSEEEKLRSTKGVEADSKRNESVAGEAQKSRDTLANIAMARALLKRNPTSSGFGALVDSGANFFGTSTKSADAAAQLDTLSGWMVNNVPRMEGPQSNFDVQNYKTMAALVGDRTKPLSQRIAALDTLQELQQKYAALNKGGNAVNSTSTTEEKPKSLLNELPKTAAKGTRIRDTVTGEKLEFNGLSWVKVK